MSASREPGDTASAARHPADLSSPTVQTHPDTQLEWEFRHAPPPASPMGAPVSGETMVQLRGVTKRFGSVTAVDAVDLTIRKGEFLTLLGPSGCGKTTLLRLLAGFETPTAGEILIEGHDVSDIPPYRRDVNQVFQSYAIFPHLTVEENIAFGLKMRHVPAAERRERAEEALGLVSLAGLGRRRPHELSGGQRQRVALARALVCRPKVLLLDEPLSALDAKLRRAMQLELKHLQRQLGITFVFVTHDQEEALIMSDRIAVIHRGRIDQLGTATEIYHAPASAFTADFIGEANLLDSAVMANNGVTAQLQLGEGAEVSVRASAVQPGATRVLVSVRPEKIYITRTKPAKENTFKGVIEEEIFRGAMDELRIRIAGGLQLMAVVANESAHEHAWHKGDTVFCAIHTDDIVVVEQK
ncbi:MAG: ABC transporter ATP-binding protein [Opitutaceae bacterium]